MLPEHIVEALGCEAIDGAVFTVSVAAFEVNGDGQVPETMQRYRFPLLDAIVAFTLNVSLFQFT